MKTPTAVPRVQPGKPLMKFTSSIVICVLDNFEGLKKCLGSILRQSLPPKEIIVVHSGTSAEIGEYLSAMRSVQKNIGIYYSISEKSLVMQRNKGIDLSSGDVVFFIDDDAVLENDYLRQVMKYYESNWDDLGGVQGTIFSHITIKEDPLTRMRKFFKLSVLNGDGRLYKSGYPSFLNYFPIPREVEVFNGCMMSFKREILLKERFDENLKENWFGDDIELSYRISRSFRLVQIPKAIVHHVSSTPTYEGIRRLTYMSILNRDYIFEKFFSPKRGNYFFYYLALTGDALMSVRQSLIRRSLSPLAGFYQGIEFLYIHYRKRKFLFALIRLLKKGYELLTLRFLGQGSASQS